MKRQSVLLIFMGYFNMFGFKLFLCNFTGPHFADSEEWDAVSKILLYSYTLHQHRLTVQAVKLYNLMNSLVDADWGTHATLRFLAYLAGEVQGSPQYTNMRVTPSLKDKVRSVVWAQ
jgi:hypothetical protein